jgi:hypothetical protein
MPLYQPQIPHDLTWDRARAAAPAVKSQKLTPPELWNGVLIPLRALLDIILTVSLNLPSVASNKLIAQKEVYGRWYLVTGLMRRNF